METLYGLKKKKRKTKKHCPNEDHHPHKAENNVFCEYQVAKAKIGRSALH